MKTGKNPTVLKLTTIVEEYTQAVDIKNIKSETLPCGQALVGGEMIDLMQACARDTTPAGARDAALVAVLYSAGCALLPGI